LIFAWAHALAAEEIPVLLKPFPGLGAVLNPSNYGAAFTPGGTYLAYLTSTENAKYLRSMEQAGASFAGFLVNDERNVSGPSGTYLPPTIYSESLQEIMRSLPPGVPVITMGLAALGGWWREFFWNRKYDDDYAQEMPITDLRAFNPNKVRMRELRRVLRKPGPHWLLSPAPFNTWLSAYLQPIRMRAWLELSTDLRVWGVAFWSLVQVPYRGVLQPHGLYSTGRVLTHSGRVLRAYLLRKTRGS